MALPRPYGGKLADGNRRPSAAYIEAGLGEATIG